MDPVDETRNDLLARFSKYASERFAASPTTRSVLLAVAQYWNDEAEDDVHGEILTSQRDTPAWPHECAIDEEDRDLPSDERGSPLVGERCSMCGGEELWFTLGWGPELIRAIEGFCPEGAHQEMAVAEAYLPFAVARRVGGGVAVERVGHPQRTPARNMGRDGPDQRWPDERARALFGEVCRSPDDDAPRAVLSDYLREHYPDDPRGEAIALALAPELDAEGCERRDALFAAHQVAWMSPLGEVIAAGGAHYARGFLARAEVFAGAMHLHDAPAWGTVRELTFLPGSADVISPAMASLRAVGPFRGDGLRAVASAPVSWGIEAISVARTAALEPLMHAVNLPRLRRLEVAADREEEVVRGLPTAPWRGQLEELVFVANEHGSWVRWRELRARLGVSTLGVALASPIDTAWGWEIGFRADGGVSVRSAAFGPDTTLTSLARMVHALPDAEVALVSSSSRVMTEEDAAILRERSGRVVRLLR